MRPKPVLGCCTAFLGGTLLIFAIYNMLRILVKVQRRSSSTQVAGEHVQIPSQVHEQRVLDELGSLKNEIHQLSEENIKLQSLLNDLNSSIKDQKKNAIDSKGDLNSLKDNVQKFMDMSSTKNDEHMHHDNTVVADKLYNSTRVLCWIMTQPKNLETKATAVKLTWGRRCNKLLFFSSVGNDSFPVIGLNTKEGREFLTEKTFKAFRYVYKHYFNDYDWFMRVDDDGYVIMENLRYFLSGQDTKSPIYFGHKFKVIVKQGFFSGGPGIVLSKEALHRFSTKGLEVCCNETNRAYIDDVNIGFCMETLGVSAGTSLDSLGRTRFHCLNPQDHLTGRYPDWLYKYDAYGAQKGMSSMSDYAIGFHYVSPEMCYLLDYAVYHLRPYGVHFKDQDLNVPVN